jgi:general secretion pathway protein F
MPLYKFKVTDAAGKLQDLLIEGVNESDATRRVQSRGLLPLECLGTGEAAGSSGKGLGFGNKFDVVDFTDRLVPLLQAAIPLERSLAIMEDGARGGLEKELLTSLRRGLHEGRKFSQLIRDRGRLFPKMYAGIVEAGEESGALAQVLAQLRDYLAQTREMRQYIISASIYPCLLLAFSLIVNVILLGKVVPRFGAVITSSGKTPSFSTQALLHLSDFVNHCGLVAMAVIPGLIIFLVALARHASVRRFWDEFSLKVPLWRHLVLLSNVARQARTMAILMKSGVPLLETVTISSTVLQNEVLKEALSSLSGDLRRGERLSASLSRNPYMPPLMIRMLAVGEETGEAAEMLNRVADRYDHELKTLIKRLLSWFEPLVILFLGAVVGTIIMVLFMAILEMQTSF